MDVAFQLRATHRETVKIESNAYIEETVPCRRCPETSFPLVTGGGKQKKEKKRMKEEKETRGNTTN